jgi:hypothetical protein
MYTMPMIFPLDGSGRVYVLQDKNGQVVGSGSREVCERLLSLIGLGLTPATENTPSAQTANVRAAITI